MDVDITIIMPTYNKQKYIAKALDSILMQETTYTYKIIIADDCSSDSTLEIAERYSMKHPGIIEILPSEVNQKLYKNIVRVYENLCTPYFCVLDPDDYWTDNKKIQKALDFLENNKDYTIYCANTLLVHENTGGGGVNPYIPLHESKMCTFADYLQGGAISPQTSSVVYRNVVFANGLPNQMRNFAHLSCEISFRGDSFRNIIHLHEGKLHYEPEIVAVYLLTDSGIWQSMDNFNQLIFNSMFCKNMWLYYDKKYPELLVKSYMLYCNLMCRENFEQIFACKEDKLYSHIITLQDMHGIFMQNRTVLESFQFQGCNELKTKYKFFLSVYKKLYNKLAKKNLSWLFKGV